MWTGKAVYPHNLGWWLIILMNFAGFFIMRFGMAIPRDEKAKVITELPGDIILTISFILMFWIFGIKAGLVLIPIFWFAVTPMVEILIERIGRVLCGYEYGPTTQMPIGRPHPAYKNKLKALSRISEKIKGVSAERPLTDDGLKTMFEDLEKHTAILKELFVLVHQDTETNKLLQQYGISDQELEDLYRRLMREGLGHWMAASTFVFKQTLEYVLKNRHKEGNEFSRVCSRLWDYFYYNRVGEIQD